MSGQNEGVAKISRFQSKCHSPVEITFWPRTPLTATPRLSSQNILATNCRLGGQHILGMCILATVAKMMSWPKLWPRRNVNFGNARSSLATSGQNLLLFWPRMNSRPKPFIVFATFWILAMAGQNILATAWFHFGHSCVYFSHCWATFWPPMRLFRSLMRLFVSVSLCMSRCVSVRLCV